MKTFKKGLKITVEGPRASGKTLMSLKIVKLLESQGYLVKHSMGIIDTVEIISDIDIPGGLL
jgi:pantothenate kinase-related protein Tda10